MALDHEAIYESYKGIVVSIDDSAGAFDKDGKSVELDEAKVAEARKSIDDAYAATKYQRDRAAEYPTWQELIGERKLLTNLHFIRLSFHAKIGVSC